MYQKFIKDVKVVNPHLRVIGLTVTPYRLKGGEICKPENILNHICYEVGIKEMIVQGYLCKLKSRGGGRRRISTTCIFAAETLSRLRWKLRWIPMRSCPAPAMRSSN
jgi:hypothetical protein